MSREKLDIYACSGIHSIGLTPRWEDNYTLKKYLSEGAEYFLYTYINPQEMYLYPKKVKDKYYIQMKTRQWIRDIFVNIYGTDEDLDKLIRQNIVKTFADHGANVSSPEEVLRRLQAGEEYEFIGISDVVLAAIITAVIGLVSTCIGYLVDYFMKKEFEEIRSKYTVPTAESILSGTPNASDWPNLDEALGTKQQTAGASKWMLLALIPTALYMMFGNKKSKTKIL